MRPEETTQENFVTIRCFGCHKILFEADEKTVGKIRKKCDKCKELKTISLPLIGKKNNLQTVSV